MLKVTPYEKHGLRWWYDQSLDEKINMNPPYQRRADIWGKWKRAHLIDSIINDFDIPKFYVADFIAAPSQALNDQNKALAIIDGKQRLGAIFDFFGDKFPLNPSCVLDDLPDIKLGGLRYSDLIHRYPSVAAKIDHYVPTVMNVATDQAHKIEELFVRLNMGEAANGAERRNAMGGPVPMVVRELSQHPFFINKIRFSTKRMQEYNLAVKILLIEFKNGFVDLKAKNLDDFAKNAIKWFDERDKEIEELSPIDIAKLPNPYFEARDRIYETLELLTKEFHDGDRLLARQGEIPIYYWLAKQHPSWVNELRDFVLLFSEELLENLRAQREDGAAVNSELSSYYAASRTTNDQSSLELRYKIFRRRFVEFRKPGGRRA